MKNNFEEFKKRIKKIRKEGETKETKQVENGMESIPSELMTNIEELLKQFIEEDSRLQYHRFQNGFHVIFSNAVNLRIIIRSLHSNILIYQLNTNQGSLKSKIYQGELKEEEIIEKIEEALLSWYHSLF